MNQPGIGAMLHYLGGGSEHDPKEYYGIKIASASFSEEKLVLGLSDGRKISLWDNGQSCCEYRYMTTDDDPQKLVGGALRNIEVKRSEETEGEYGECHEIAFIEVATDDGFITVATHNEHNGYYGGFGLTITEEAA